MSEVDILCKKATRMRLAGNFKDSLFYYQKVLSIDPEYAPAWNGSGTANKYLKKFRKAMLCYERALEIDPKLESAEWNRCLLHLLLGDYEKGKLRYGWLRPGYPLSGVEKIREEYDQPIWDGEKLNGTLLLSSQHGLGDVINFIRYAGKAKMLCKKVIVETHLELKTILKMCPYIDEVYSIGEKLPIFDKQMEIAYLPFLFKKIPSTPYIFPKSNDLGKIIASSTKYPNVGIVWKGNPNHPNDIHRSCHLNYFEPLLDYCKLFSLQKDTIAKNKDIVSFGPVLKSMADTAGIVKELDLVISVDTSVAHLAGAMGKPVWLLLPYLPDWRWGYAGCRTHWYKSMEIFRQSQIGNWESVFEEVIASIIFKKYYNGDVNDQ